MIGDDEREKIRIHGRVFKTLLMSLNVCTFCKHFGMDVSKEDGIRVCCDAFPEGIPRSIFSAGYDHREPFPNDNGIRFEVRPDLDEQDEERLKRMQELLFSESNNKEILRMREMFWESKKNRKPEYDVYDYDGYDEDDDEFDFKLGEKLIEKYHIKIPDFLEDYDLDSMKPRYEKELKSE